MANEFKHGSVGTSLTQSEWEAVGTHVLDSQATGDIIYASSATQLSRLAKGTDGQVLTLASGIPSWATSTVTIKADDIATGDGAVNFATTVGNITIDAQANDADVIIKVDDNGSPVTAVTFDGSEAGKAIFAGGNNPSRSNVIDFINITTTGDASDFGDLVSARDFVGSTGNQNYMITFGGNTAAGAANITNIIEFVHFDTASNTTDFGDMTDERQNNSNGVSNHTRGIMGGGHLGPAHSNIIDYVTYASMGDASDFGDMTAARMSYASAQSGTRGLFGGGYSPSNSDVVEYITMASTGNATDFGDLTNSARGQGGFSSDTRALMGAGNTPSLQDNMDYFTIASTGDATDFGNLSAARTSPEGSSTKIRGVLGGGAEPSIVNTIDYFTIATTGNATDFGDMTGVRKHHGAASNSHGGV